MQFDQMKRRGFITLLGGAATWPLAARAQQGERMRRVGGLMNLAADDPEASRRLITFVQRLHQLGWTEGGNVRIDIRWGSDADLIRKYAANWSRSTRTPSWPLEARPRSRCYRRPAPCRSCSR